METITEIQVIHEIELKAQEILAAYDMDQYKPTVTIRRVEKSNRYPIIDDIINAVCRYYNVTLYEIKSPTRKKEIVRARHMLTYLLYHLIGLHEKRIGMIIGRERTTALAALRVMAIHLELEADLRNELDQIKNSL